MSAWSKWEKVRQDLTISLTPYAPILIEAKKFGKCSQIKSIAPGDSQDFWD
ncbi:hypothetical protein [Microcoleus sp. herbarium12]|jgi:hypothetical protein|uniref:hypothetical protein n=1 Tax=Microcoleus sp. herbarium12 TaxID=3055437 RepID=UPI002FD0B730